MQELQGAVDAIEAKERVLGTQIGRLEAQQATTRASNQAASAIDVAQAAIGASSVDAITTKLDREHAIASDRLARATSALTGGNDVDAQAQALLARLGGAKTKAA